MKDCPLLTAELIRAIADYDPKTGILSWRISPGPRVQIGETMSSLVTKGYHRFKYKGRTYATHRAIWLWTYGAWPNGQIDHINRIRTDNRLCNLRIASQSQNAMNSKRRNDNKSGIRGVSWHSRMGKWTARLNVNQRTTWLGTFTNKEDAEKAYLRAASEHYGDFINGS